MVTVEEALRCGVPVLMIDVKGDLPNLLLAFEQISGEALSPWIEGTGSPADARLLLERAAEAAQEHRTGLEGWGIRSEDVADYARKRHVRVKIGQVFQQRTQIGRLALRQAPLGQHREQHVLATLGGVGVSTQKAQHQRHRRAQRRARRLGVGVPALSRLARARASSCTCSPRWSADRARVLDGLSGAGGAGDALSAAELGKIVKRLAQRWFLMRDAHSKQGIVMMQARWTMSFIRGPMTRTEIRRALGAELRPLSAPSDNRPPVPA